jgi:hypothetical protein
MSTIAKEQKSSTEALGTVGNYIKQHPSDSGV